MLLSASKFPGGRRRFAIFAVALLFVAGGAVYWLRDSAGAGTESGLLADAGECYSLNRNMALSLNGYVPSDDRPPTPAERKQIEAVDKLAKAAFQADAVLPTLRAAVAAAGPNMSSDRALQAALERVATLKSEPKATVSKDDGAAPSQPRAPAPVAAADRAELADIFIEPECRAVNTAAVLAVGQVIKTVLRDGVEESSKMSDADLRNELSSKADHDPDYEFYADGLRGAAKFWYAELLNALSPEEIAALKRYRAASQARRAALVNAYRQAVKNATVGLLFDYLRGDVAASR